MAESTFQCQLISPEQTVLDAPVTFAALTAHDGQIGIGTNRAPLVCKLGIGPMRVDTVDGSKRFFVDGGFARMTENKLVVLTPYAIPAEDLDRAQAKFDLTEAQALPLSDPTRSGAVARAKTQVALTTGD